MIEINLTGNEAYQLKLFLNHVIGKTQFSPQWRLLSKNLKIAKTAVDLIDKERIEVEDIFHDVDPEGNKIYKIEQDVHGMDIRVPQWKDDIAYGTEVADILNKYITLELHEITIPNLSKWPDDEAGRKALHMFTEDHPFVTVADDAAVITSKKLAVKKERNKVRPITS